MARLAQQFELAIGYLDGSGTTRGPQGGRPEDPRPAQVAVHPGKPGHQVTPRGSVLHIRLPGLRDVRPAVVAGRIRGEAMSEKGSATTAPREAGQWMPKQGAVNALALRAAVSATV